MEQLEYRVEKAHHQKTVQYIALRVLGISAGAFRSMKFSGGIERDGAAARSTDRVQAGDLLRFTFPESCAASLPAHAVDIRVLYEDAFYYALEKPAPLPTMYSHKQGGPTLETGLYHFLGCPDDYVFRPVNRLDKGTSGLMMVAKNAHAQQRLQKELHTERFLREYTALCDGVPPMASGVINAPIATPGEVIRRFISPDGKPAVTNYRTLKTGHAYSLLQLRLETGRTHQIRVHLESIGCPVLGDYVYGREHPFFPGRFALHSTRVQFYHPFLEKEIEIISKPPQMWYDMVDEKIERELK